MKVLRKLCISELVKPPPEQYCPSVLKTQPVATWRLLLWWLAQYGNAAHMCNDRGSKGRRIPAAADPGKLPGRCEAWEIFRKVRGLRAHVESKSPNNASDLDG